MGSNTASVAVIGVYIGKRVLGHQGVGQLLEAFGCRASQKSVGALLEIEALPIIALKIARNAALLPRESHVSSISPGRA
jgi:hypothetical protein